MKKFKYVSCFAELIVKPLVSQEKDKLLAKASLDDIKGFIPSIDTNVNLDLLPVAFNACVINRVNKNRDVIDTATALASYKYFINKPINVEHNRQKVIGTILTAGFTSFPYDQPLTEEQVKGMTGPFNITLGGIIWRVVSPELSDHIEEASDPSSDKHLSVSASWELGFTEYKIALLEAGAKDLSEAKRIISDAAEVEKYKDKLTSFGGDGKIEDLFGYRMPSYDVLPLGIGFTEKPAAEVKGVATPSEEKVGITIPEAVDDREGKTKTPTPKSVNPPNPGESLKVGIVIPPAITDRKQILGEGDTTQENQNKISQSVKTDVKKERNQIMKLTSIKDLTDESLKECTASVVADFISSELKKGSDKWEEQKNALNTQLSQAQADSEKLKSEQSKLQEQLKQVQATVDALNAEKLEREKVEKFNSRMAAINEAYDLDDEVRAALVEDIKAIASDADFDKWQAKAKILLKGFAKKKDKKDDGDKDDAKAKKDDNTTEAKKSKADMEDGDASKKAKAAQAAQAAVDAAVDNGKKDAGLPNGTAAGDKSLKEKYQAAFARENFEIKV